ncbi:unnamed protein product [Penicillium salamii]|nr:unnamed protein product [Penicillium salamii]
MPSTSLHHTTTRLDTVLLQQLLTVPEINPNIYITNHSTISIAASCEYINTVACLLNITSIKINRKGFIDLPIYQVAANSHHDIVRLLVQEGTHLNINEGTIVSHNTTLCITASSYNLEMVQTLLSHHQINVNLQNKYFKDPLILAVKDSHILIVNTLLANTRLQYFSLKRSLKLVKNNYI